MPQLSSPLYRRDYTGEPLTYVENGEYKSLFVTPRTLPYDRSVKNAIVLGNGISRFDSQIQLILNQNNTRVVYKFKNLYTGLIPRSVGNIPVRSTFLMSQEFLEKQNMFYQIDYETDYSTNREMEFVYETIYQYNINNI